MEVVVFCPNWVGDVVMATPALRALRRLYRDAKLTGVIRPSVADTLAGNPWFDDLILCDHRAAERARRTFAVLAELRRRQADQAILFTNSIRTALLAWGAGIARRTGYAREGRGLLLNDRLHPPRRHGRLTPSPIIDYYLAIAYHLGAPSESYHMELFTAPADVAAVDRLWSKWHFALDERVVAINPGAAFGPAKRWPSDSFAALIRRLVDEQGIKCVVLCGPNERGFARYIADGSLRPRLVKSLAEEEVSLGIAKEIIRRAALLVTTDSGPRHFAAAFARPVVTLFGPTHIAWTDTYFPDEIKLQKQLPCGPCQQRECPLLHHRCMEELTVEMVHEAAARLLRAPLRRAG